MGALPPNACAPCLRTWEGESLHQKVFRWVLRVCVGGLDILKIYI